MFNYSARVIGEESNKSESDRVRLINRRKGIEEKV